MEGTHGQHGNRQRRRGRSWNADRGVPLDRRRLLGRAERSRARRAVVDGQGERADAQGVRGRRRNVSLLPRRLGADSPHCKGREPPRVGGEPYRCAAHARAARLSDQEPVRLRPQPRLPRIQRRRRDQAAEDRERPRGAHRLGRSRARADRRRVWARSRVVRVPLISGARLEETCQLRWKHVHPLPDGRATVTLHGKGGKTRHVLISAEVGAELEQLRGDSGDESHVFATRSGRALHPSNVRALLARHATRAGLRRVSPHCFRHAHASHALDNGAPVHIVQATLGHASLATTSRYVHAKPMDSAGMYLRL